MQLGELQHQLERFQRRNVQVIALSVDEAAASLAMIERLGIDFAIGSDPDQTVIESFRVQNPDTRELAIHAVYILDQTGHIYYRKVGLRRPVSQELIDAIDAHRGDYPRTDEAVAPRARVTVAYPQNEFQALLTVSAVTQLPDTVDPDPFFHIVETLEARQLDDAQVAFKKLMHDSEEASREDLLNTASWLTRVLYFERNTEAITAGQDLARRLARVTELEAALAAASDPDEKDAALHTLARARAGLTMVRAGIEQQSETWRLRSAKTTLRSYREVARAEMRLR